MAFDVKAEVFDIEKDYQSLNSMVEYWEDPDGSLNISELLENQQFNWHQNDASRFNRGYTQSTYWFRIKLDNPNTKMLKRLLEISFTQLDYIDIYDTSNNSVLYHYQMGDKYPFYQRPVVHNNYVTPLSWQANENKILYIRISTQGALQLPIYLWGESAFDAKRVNTRLAIGVLFGILLVIIIYNLFLFIRIKDLAYLYFSIYVTVSAILSLYLKGIGFQYLWPNMNESHEYILLVSMLSISLFILLFSKQFLEITSQLHPGFNRLFNICIFITLLFIPLLFIVSFSYMIRMVFLLAPIFMVPLLYIGAYRWYEGLISARYYTIAFAVVILGSIVTMLDVLAVIPGSVITKNSVQISFLLKVCMFAVALADKVSQDRKSRKAEYINAYESVKLAKTTKEKALEDQKKINDKLESLVKTRTDELMAANIYLEKISVTDALTGLHNRRSFDNKLQVEFVRSSRLQHSLSLLVIDIDKFKLINDNYGHSVGDKCIRWVADKIKKSIRKDTDLAARYGGEEFCVLLPESPIGNAKNAAEKIRIGIERSTINISDDNICLNFTVSIGIATIKKDHVGEYDEIFKQADIALYRAKENGRNQVCCFDME